MTLKLPGNLLTTAMAVIPHTNVTRALELALSLDVPFWPQMPNYSYYEDMYERAAEQFPSIVLDIDKRTLRFLPTGMEAFSREEIPSLIDRLESTWNALCAKGIDGDRLIAASMLSPATCCLINPRTAPWSGPLPP